MEASHQCPGFLLGAWLLVGSMFYRQVEVLPTVDYFTIGVSGDQGTRKVHPCHWIPLTKFLTDCDEDMFGSVLVSPFPLPSALACFR